jgi:hypothetical protein
VTAPVILLTPLITRLRVHFSILVDTRRRQLETFRLRPLFFLKGRRVECAALSLHRRRMATVLHKSLIVPGHPASTPLLTCILKQGRRGGLLGALLGKGSRRYAPGPRPPLSHTDALSSFF